ncbi:LysR family transcriptional regulator [Scopulibacillus cellulosilyticus]|uniref:LysR family transcriptional regulator n=1 Tax=Scopulibacillus cellulosilyticus TaxID=2665665 RepID=A0ABW2Q1P4_9BACL
MELRHLRYFIAVAEELHFGKAAERLKIAQPPLSHQIKQLETELGVPLLYRTKRKVELTEAGKVFLKRCYQILSDVNKACEEAQSIYRGEIGQLTIGFGGAVYDLLPPILDIYQNKYPNLKIIFQQLTTSDQVKALTEGKIDVGLLVSPIDSPHLKFEVIREEPFIAALPKTHRLAKLKQPIDVSELANEPFIMTPRSVGPSYYDAIISLCFQAGFSPKTSQEVQELQTILALVASGMGAALLPSSFQFLKNDDVVYLPLKKSKATCKIAAAWHKDNKSPIVHSFLNLIRELMIPYMS